MQAVIQPTNQWIKEKLANHSEFLDQMSYYLRYSLESFPTDEIRPNFFYQDAKQKIIGWISELQEGENEPNQLFIGLNKTECWIYAICDE